MAAHNHMAGAHPRIDRQGARWPDVPPASGPEGDAPASPSVPNWSGQGPSGRRTPPAPGYSPPKADDGDRTRSPPHPAPNGHPAPRTNPAHHRDARLALLPRDLSDSRRRSRVRCFPQGIHRGSGTNGSIRDRMFLGSRQQAPSVGIGAGSCQSCGIFRPARYLPIAWGVPRGARCGVVISRNISNYFKISLTGDRIAARLWLNLGNAARFGLIHNHGGQPSAGRAP